MTPGAWCVLLIAVTGCSSGGGTAAEDDRAKAAGSRGAGTAAADARVWGHQTLDHLLAIGAPGPAFETELAIIGHAIEEAARIAGAPSHEETSYSGDFSSMPSVDHRVVYEFALTGLTDGHPIAVSPELRLGDRGKRHEFVSGFRLTLPATDVAPDVVMAGLRKKYGRPDHHSHDGLGVIWTRVRRTEAVMSMTGVAIAVSRPEDAFGPLEVAQRDYTTNRACDGYVAVFDAFLACAAIPLADRLAAAATFRETSQLWMALRFQPIVGDGQDHSRDGDDFEPAPKDIAAATSGCTAARVALKRTVTRAGCSLSP